MPRYYLTLPDPAKARLGGDFGFRAHGAPEFARELQEALTSDAYFQRWLATQEHPDGVDPQLGATDPDATVTGEQHDLHTDLLVNTSLKGEVLKHRLRLLAGPHWQLKDVTN